MVISWDSVALEPITALPLTITCPKWPMYRPGPITACGLMPTPDHTSTRRWAMISGKPQQQVPRRPRAPRPVGDPVVDRGDGARREPEVLVRRLARQHLVPVQVGPEVRHRPGEPVGVAWHDEIVVAKPSRVREGRWSPHEQVKVLPSRPGRRPPSPARWSSRPCPGTRTRTWRSTSRSAGDVGVVGQGEPRDARRGRPRRSRSGRARAGSPCCR